MRLAGRMEGRGKRRKNAGWLRVEACFTKLSHQGGWEYLSGGNTGEEASDTCARHEKYQNGGLGKENAIVLDRSLPASTWIKLGNLVLDRPKW